MDTYLILRARRPCFERWERWRSWKESSFFENEAHGSVQIQGLDLIVSIERLLLPSASSSLSLSWCDDYDRENVRSKTYTPVNKWRQWLEKMKATITAYHYIINLIIHSPLSCDWWLKRTSLLIHLLSPYCIPLLDRLECVAEAESHF